MRIRIASGEYGGRMLRTTSGPGYRPATGKVRQALFSLLEARGVYWPETRTGDFFAGSGSLGFEALSRGAPLVWFVEKAANAARLIGENAHDLRVEPERWQLCATDLLKLLEKGPRTSGLGKPFDLVFIDPPYGKKLLAPAISRTLGRGWVVPGGMVAAEVEAALELDADAAHPRLETITDRTYGQTRIIVWKTKANVPPSIPEPSIP